MIGLLGKKLGMTHVYDEFGRRIAVTAIQAGPCTVVSIREPTRDHYHAVQVGFEPVVKEAKLSKPVLGQFKKFGKTKVVQEGGKTVGAGVITEILK